MDNDIKVSRIFAFNNGTRIDLKKIISIGAIEKDEFYNIIVKIYCTGYNKPIVFILGNAIGSVTPEQKNNIETTYNYFLNEWEQFINLSND